MQAELMRFVSQTPIDRTPLLGRPNPQPLYCARWVHNNALVKRLGSIEFAFLFLQVTSCALCTVLGREDSQRGYASLGGQSLRWSRWMDGRMGLQNPIRVLKFPRAIRAEKVKGNEGSSKDPVASPIDSDHALLQQSDLRNTSQALRCARPATLNLHLVVRLSSRFFLLVSLLFCLILPLSP